MRRWLPLVILASGCAHGAPEAGGGPEDVARECAIDLSGSWEEKGDVGDRYEATDDGRTLRLVPHRVNADGTALAQDATAGKVEIDLHRALGQVAGDFRMPEATGTGETCPLLLHAQLTSCSPDRMVLEIEQNYALNQRCTPSDLGSIASDSHVLVRTK